MYIMWTLLLLSLLSSSLASPDELFLPRIENVNGKYDGYRLPTTTVPLKYEIKLNIPDEALNGGSTNYSGTVNILFQVREYTNTIRIHSLVDITKLNITQGNILVEHENHTANATTEIVTILLTTNLTINVNYNLLIEYTASLDTVNMMGFYRSEYNLANGTKEYLGTTQFQPTHARRVFPSFDEPMFKANFQLTIQYPLGFTAVSNTPGINLSNDQSTTTSFQDTPIMSTYLLAFTITKFTCTRNTDVTAVNDNTPFGVCSRTAFAADRNLALDYGIQLMAALDNWTGHSYNVTSIGKMDQFAIPDFSAGAMENWGLVTYREYMLLYNQEYTSNFYKQRIIAVIAHEFAHMWFGNLVTCQWWNYTFLNEGFARYFQYFLLSKISSLESYEIEKQFIIEQQQTAFIADSYSNSQSLTSDAWTPAQISNKFSTISYNKGASILRMVENVIGSNVFQSSLQTYLNLTAFTATTPKILWSTIGANVLNGSLPNGLTLTEIIDNWTNKAGFPVINARVSGNDIVLTQNRFLYNISATDSTQWYVPITFITSNETTSTPIWLQPNGTITISNAANQNWTIINHNSAGYYRVHYDNTLRAKLVQVFLNNRLLITDINRAQILDDAFNLARAGQIKYSEVFQFLPYLKNETCYYPWYVVIRGMNYLSVRFGNESVLGQKVASLLLQHFNNTAMNMSSYNWTTVSHKDSLKSQLLLTSACRLGHPTCVSEAKNLFRYLRDNNTSVNPNIRDVVYCNALRYSDDIERDWTFLWNRLHAIDQPHETIYILVGLGCARNKDRLSYYLDQSFNSSSIIRIQDFATVWSAVYGSGSVGLEVAFEKFRNNHTHILNYYSGAISVLSGITDRFTSEAQLTQLQTLINSIGANTTVGSAATSALTEARQNLQWQSSVKSDLEQHFNLDGNSATSFGVSILLITIGILITI